MDTDQNWYRQLVGLILLSASKAAVEFVTNPGSRDKATEQLRGAFAQIDYDALASALTSAIDNMAEDSKDKLNDAIDLLRDRSVDAVEEAKGRAEKQLGQKKGGGKLKWFLLVAIAGFVTYFILDEQRRDNMMDKLTGASGPIQPPVQKAAQQAQSMGQDAAQQAGNVVQQASQTAQNASNPVTDQTQS